MIIQNIQKIIFVPLQALWCLSCFYEFPQQNCHYLPNGQVTSQNTTNSYFFNNNFKITKILYRFCPSCKIHICLSCLYESPKQNPLESISFFVPLLTQVVMSESNIKLIPHSLNAHFVPFVFICTFGLYLYITKF